MLREEFDIKELRSSIPLAIERSQTSFNDFFPNDLGNPGSSWPSAASFPIDLKRHHAQVTCAATKGGQQRRLLVIWSGTGPNLRCELMIQFHVLYRHHRARHVEPCIPHDAVHVPGSMIASVLVKLSVFLKASSSHPAES